MNSIRGTVVSCLAFVAVVLGFFYYSTVREPVLSDEQLRAENIYVLPQPRDIGGFSLVDQHGVAFGREQLNGQWTLAFFGFTHCPDICPTTMGILSAAMDELSWDEIRVALVSVDPERDTPERMRDYVGYFDERMLGLTGSHAQIAALATQLNVAFGKSPGATPDTYSVDHSANVVIINPHGHYHGFIRTPDSKEQIVRAMKTLVASF